MPLTSAEIRRFTRQIDSLVIVANSEGELHRKLNALTTNGDKRWQMLRWPVRRDGLYIAVVVKPDDDVK